MSHVLLQPQKKIWQEFWLDITLLAHYLVKEMHLLEVQILMIVMLILESTSVSASIQNEQSEQYTASCATLSPFLSYS